MEVRPSQSAVFSSTNFDPYPTRFQCKFQVLPRFEARLSDEQPPQRFFAFCFLCTFAGRFHPVSDYNALGVGQDAKNSKELSYDIDGNRQNDSDDLIPFFLRVWYYATPEVNLSRRLHVWGMASRMRSYRFISLLVLFSALLLSGCIGLIPSPFRPSPGPQKTPQAEDLAQAFDIVCRNYRLGPADTMRILFQTEWNIPDGTYVLDTLDEIDIEFILDPGLNRKVTIRPDGRITLPGIGDVRAAGLTPEQLSKRLEKEYLEREIFTKDETRGALENYRRVTVSVTNFFQKVRKLVESLTTLTGGQQTSILVGPDGKIDLPLLDDRILAAGHTVREVERTVNQCYRAGPLRFVVASMSLLQAQSRKVYVLGQVNNPGAYDITQPITALHAIALAGGEITDTADLTSVILVSKDASGKPLGRRLDLKRTLDVGDMASAILVKPYDVIYVPNTYIRDVRIFMEQYVKTVSDVASLISLLK